MTLITDTDNFLGALSGKNPPAAPPVEPPAAPPAEPNANDNPPPATPVENNPPAPPPPKVGDNADDTPPAVKTIEDYNKMISEKFGVENIDALLDGDVVDKYKGYDGLKTRVSEFEKEVPALYDEFKKTGNPFVNEFTFKLNHLQKEHPELDPQTAVTLVNANLGEMSSTDALLMNKRIGNPEFTDAQAKTLVAMDYGFDSWDELQENDDSNKSLMIDAKAATAKKELSKYNVSDVEFDKEKSILPENIQEKIKAQTKAQEEAHAKIEETWSPLTDGFEKSFDEFPIVMSTKDDGTEEFSKIKLTAEDKKAYSANVREYAKIKGYTEINDDNIQDVQRYLRDMIILTKYPSMVKIAVDKAVSDTKLAIEKEKFNPSGSGNGNSGGNNRPPAGSTGKKSLTDIIESQSPTPKLWDKVGRRN